MPKMLFDCLLLIPLVALLLFFVPLRWKWWVAVTLVTLGVVASGMAAIGTLTTAKATAYRATTNLIFDREIIAVDGLSAVFLLMISLVTVSVTIYARGYLSASEGKKTPLEFSIHYFSLIVMYVAMMMVVVVQDGLLFLLAWELMTLASFVLILFESEQMQVRRAALNYLILMHIGLLFVLAGFVTLYSAELPVSFDSLSTYFERGEYLAVFVLFLVGFGMKAGLFPLHIWLPETHPAAPSHISALMSGVMIKMGVYGVMRVTSYLASEQLYTVGLILFVAGIVTGVWGVILATLQNNIKKLLAYSSIENIGIVFIALGFGLMGKSQHNDLLAMCGFGGALLHCFNHAFFKSMLFLGAGNVYRATGTTSLGELGGVGKRMPITALLFLVGTMALCALPALSGFISEFLIYLSLLNGLAVQGSLSIEGVFGLIFLAFISGLVVMAMVKLYGIVFQGNPRSEAPLHAHEVKRSMLAAMGIPLSAIVLVGLLPIFIIPLIFNVVGTLFSIFDPMIYYGMISNTISALCIALWVLVAIILALVGVRQLLLSGRPVAQSPTWGCGFTAITSKMQYSSDSFSDGLGSLSLRRMNKSKEQLQLGNAEIFPSSHNFDVGRKNKAELVLSQGWIALLRPITARMSGLRTAKIQHYILYTMLLLMLVFLLTIFNWLK